MLAVVWDRRLTTDDGRRDASSRTPSSAECAGLGRALTRVVVEPVGEPGARWSRVAS